MPLQPVYESLGAGHRQAKGRVISQHVQMTAASAITAVLVSSCEMSTLLC